MKDSIEAKGCRCGRCTNEGKGPCQLPPSKKIPKDHEIPTGKIKEKNRIQDNRPGANHPTDQEKHKGPRF